MSIHENQTNRISVAKQGKGRRGGGLTYLPGEVGVGASRLRVWFKPQFPDSLLYGKARFTTIPRQQTRNPDILSENTKNRNVKTAWFRHRLIDNSEIF